MAFVATLRNVTHGANCARCGMNVTAPEWSESAGPEDTVHLWHCWYCGNEFETSDHHGMKEPPVTELIEEFLPNLLVA